MSFRSVFSKLINHLGGGQNRSPLGSDSVDSSELEHELLVVTKTSELSRASFQDGFPTPSPPCTPVERMETPDQDEVLFSKNNVCLSYPRRVSFKTQELTRFSNDRNRIPSPQMLPSLATSENSNSNSSASGDSFQDNQILVPGYLFITTRGSNYGTTLILNWAPNSSMKVPPVPVNSSLPLHLQPSTSINSLTISTLTNGDQIDTSDRTDTAAADGVIDEVTKRRTNGSHITEYTEGDVVVVTTEKCGDIPKSSWPAITITGRGGEALATGTGKVEKVGAGSWFK